MSKLVPLLVSTHVLLSFALFGQCPPESVNNVEIHCYTFTDNNCTSQSCGGSKTAWAHDVWYSGYLESGGPVDCTMIGYDYMQCADHGPPIGLEFNVVSKTLKCKSECSTGCGFQDECQENEYWDDQNCECVCEFNCSPVLISLDDNQLELTDRSHGVTFDLNADGFGEQRSWTAPGASEAFLVLDRNGNGLIDSGQELFGDVTLQASSSSPNGFRALAELDLPRNGGDGDNWLEPDDERFESLQLWVDSNHDGVSQPGELMSLTEAGIERIDLDYRSSHRRDRFGNLLRFRSKVHFSDQRHRYAYDVFFR